MIALVTGANRGIGLEVAKQLAQLGYTVVAGSRTLQNLPQLERVVWQQLDITKLAEVQRLAAFLESEYGNLDVLVNNAAINYDTWHTASSADLTEVHQTLETNLFGAWNMVQAVLPLLWRSAKIVNVSSQAGSLASMGASAPGYSVSKAALNALTLSLAAELKPRGIVVNAVCPGWTNTDMGGGGRPVADGAKSVVQAVGLASSGGFWRDGVRLEW
jgi:NAD(P)-dependent dehydrogenase (short-subunit alcohol dehydrogenase family)